MESIYLGIGTNLGDKISNIYFALENIRTQIGVISAVSSVYESKAWGFESENCFYNLAIEVVTELSPKDLLSKCKQIELDAGRKIKVENSYSDRILDIDILYFNNLEIEQENLIIPHPLISERNFVLAPLAEIAKNLFDTKKNVTIQELFLNCHDKTIVEKLPINLDWRNQGT